MVRQLHWWISVILQTFELVSANEPLGSYVCAVPDYEDNFPILAGDACESTQFSRDEIRGITSRFNNVLRCLHDNATVLLFHPSSRRATVHLVKSLRILITHPSLKPSLFAQCSPEQLIIDLGNIFVESLNGGVLNLALPYPQIITALASQEL